MTKTWDPKAGGPPIGGVEGDIIQKASAQEFDTRWVSQRAPATAARFDGTAGNFFETPDVAALDLAGDIEVIVWAAATDWTNGGTQVFLSKLDSAATGSGGYEAGVDLSGLLRFLIADGTAARLMTAPAVTLVDGQGYWLKFSYNNTAKTCTFYFSQDPLTCPLDQLQFKLIGTSAAHAGASPANNATALRVADRGNGGGFPLTGRIGRATVKNGINGTIVADWRGDAPMNPRFRDSAQKVWTVSGSAWVWVVQE